MNQQLLTTSAIRCIIYAAIAIGIYVVISLLTGSHLFSSQGLITAGITGLTTFVVSYILTIAFALAFSRNK